MYYISMTYHILLSSINNALLFHYFYIHNNKILKWMNQKSESLLSSFLLLLWPSSTVFPFWSSYPMFLPSLADIFPFYLHKHKYLLEWTIMLRVIKWRHQLSAIIVKFLHLWLGFYVSFSRPFLPLPSWISLITLFHRKYSSARTLVFFIIVFFSNSLFPRGVFFLCVFFIILSLLEWVRMVFHFYFLWHFRSTKSRKGPIIMWRFFHHGNTDSCILCSNYWSL